MVENANSIGTSYHHWITNFENLEQFLSATERTAACDEFRKCTNKRVKLGSWSTVLTQGSLHCCQEY